jgi:hypothetical protein
LTRDPVSGDLCHDHQTHHEDAVETALIEEHREAGGMEQVLRAASSISARVVIYQAQA